MSFRSAIYRGHLTHARREPVQNRFRYPICQLLFDLDELPELSDRLRFFSHNRPNLLSLHDRDYQSVGPPGASLKQSVLAALPPGLSTDLSQGGRVLLLTHARMLGHVFNPVSFFYCLDASGALRAVVAEVNNTFGDCHRYVLDAGNQLPSAQVDGASFGHDKLLHVSPFIDMLARYEFHFLPATLDESAGAPIEVRMDVFDARLADRPPFFVARLTGTRQPLDDRALVGLLLRYPLMTMQVVGLIHWQALGLFRRGVPFHSQPRYDPDAARKLHDQQTVRRVVGADLPGPAPTRDRPADHPRRHGEVAARPPDAPSP